MSGAPPTSTPPPGAKPLWGSTASAAPVPAAATAGVSQSSRYARATRHLFGDEELEPLSRRLLQAAGFLSLLLILVVLNSLLNSEGESPFDPNPVAAAAERTQAAPGMRFEMQMRIETESAPPAVVDGAGVYNGEDNLSEITYHAASPEGTKLEFIGILGEDGWFFRYPQFADRLPDGKGWVKVEGLPGQSDASKVSESPDDSLQMLQGAGAVQEAGRARVRGARTTRYRATLTSEGIVSSLRAQGKDELADQFEAIELAGSIHAEVFVDEQGTLRRMHTAITVVAEGKAVTTDMRMDFFDLGIHPTIEVPDDSQVLDVSPLLEEQMEALGEPS